MQLVRALTKIEPRRQIDFFFTAGRLGTAMTVAVSFSPFQVPPPLASIRCGTAGARGAFVPVLPSMPPIGVALRVPRGIAWQRDMVAWGTMLAAAAGTLYTVYTLWTKVSIDTAQVADRKKQTKNHAD